MNLTTQKECIEYIHSLNKFGKKAGLANISALCEYLGNPQDKLKFIHIAGTNGKGSVCAMLSAVLKQKYKVGCYTSPYIEVFNERIQINGNNISESHLIKYTNIVKQAVEATGITPIEFEFITAMGFLYFSDQCCDVVVLETGLGGRLDSTNIIKNPLLCVICAIGLDHTSILGGTISEIAFEKAGIIKQGAPVVIYKNQHPDAVGQIQKMCSRVSAQLLNNDGTTAQTISCTLRGTEFIYKGNTYRISLCGEYQVQNAVTAIDAATALQKQLNITHKDIVNGINEARWKCRFDVINKQNTTYVFDGAHNSHGIDAFVKSVNKLLADVPKTFVFGMLNEKDYEQSIAKICSVESTQIIVTDVPSARQTNSGSIYNEVKSKRSDAIYVSDCRKALEYAKSITPNGAICVFGSLYLCGELYKYIV